MTEQPTQKTMPGWIPKPKGSGEARGRVHFSTWGCLTHTHLPIALEQLPLATEGMKGKKKGVWEKSVGSGTQHIHPHGPVYDWWLGVPQHPSCTKDWPLWFQRSTPPHTAPQWRWSAAELPPHSLIRPSCACEERDCPPTCRRECSTQWTTLVTWWSMRGRPTIWLTNHNMIPYEHFVYFSILITWCIISILYLCVIY